MKFKYNPHSPIWKSAKFSVSMVLCVVIFLKAEWRELAQVIQNSDPVFLSCAFPGIVGSVFISAYKWQVLHKIHTISVTWDLSRQYFSAVFFNLIISCSLLQGDSYEKAGLLTLRHHQSIND